MKRLALIISILHMAVFSYSDTIIPRNGTTSQIGSTAGNYGEIAVDMTQKGIVIYDGKKKGGYYNASSTITVINTYNTYSTTNTINNYNTYVSSGNGLWSIDLFGNLAPNNSETFDVLWYLDAYDNIVPR